MTYPNLRGLMADHVATVVAELAAQLDADPSDLTARFLSSTARPDTPRPVPLSPQDTPHPGQDQAGSARTSEDTMTTTTNPPHVTRRPCCNSDREAMHDELCLAAPPAPVPLTPADRCEPAGRSLLAAADQLRDYCATEPAAWPGELRRRYDNVDRGALYAVAEWLTARAGLYGVTPAPAVAGFDQ